MTNLPPQPHSKSRNYLRNARFITNPPVTLNAPLKLDRSDPSDYVGPFFQLPLFSQLNPISPSLLLNRRSFSPSIDLLFRNLNGTSSLHVLDSLLELNRGRWLVFN